MNLNRKSRSKSYSVLMAVFFGLVAILVFEASAHAGKDTATSRLPISSGSEIEYPPFCIVDADGRANGFSVELLRAALAAVGRDVTFRIGTWAQVRGWLEQGEIQALPLVGRTPEREFVLDFTFPYMSLNGSIVVRKGTTDIRDLDDLRRRQVAVMKGDNAEEFLQREDRGIEIHTTATFEKALRELSKGRHEAVVIQRLLALRLIRETGLTNLRVVNQPIEGFRQDFCFAAQEGDRETLALLAELGEGLKVLEKTGEYRQIYDKWLGVHEDSRPSLFSFLRYAAIVLIPLLLLLLAFFLWSWSLRKQVARRTAELRESEEQYRLLADNTLDVIWTMNLDLEFTYVNPACFNLIGYTPEEWIGSRLPKHCDKENFAKMARAIADETARGQKGSGIIFEAVMLKKNLEPVPVENLEPVPVEIHGKVIYGDNGQPVGFQGTTRDISERRQAEQQLRRSEALLKNAQRIGKIGGWEWDVDSQELFWTEETYSIHDFDPDDIPSGGWEHVTRSMECYEKEDRPRIRLAFERCVDTGEPYELECRFTTAKGRQLWI